MVFITFMGDTHYKHTLLFFADVACVNTMEMCKPHYVEVLVSRLWFRVINIKQESPNPNFCSQAKSLLPPEHDESC